MNVSLTAELEHLVNQRVRSGMYHTASEVIREGLRLLKERDDRLAQLRADLRGGFEAVERGEYTDYDQGSIKELAGRVKARGRKRLLKERKTRP